MKYRILRFIRVVVAICMLAAFIAYFIDFTEKVPNKLAFLAKLQFLPSFLAGSFVVFGCLVAATLLFGRLYCSVICPLGILQDAIAWFGRFFEWAIRFTIKILPAFGKRSLSETMTMGMYYTPLRNISRASGGMLSWGQLGGLIIMFNGKFFKGLRELIHQGKVKNFLIAFDTSFMYGFWEGNNPFLIFET